MCVLSLSHSPSFFMLSPACSVPGICPVPLPGGERPHRAARPAGFLPRCARRTDPAQAAAAPLAGPGSDGILVTWKDNFDSFYSEVAELGRYDPRPSRGGGERRAGRSSGGSSQ